jgi:hypothetical protein
MKRALLLLVPALHALCLGCSLTQQAQTVVRRAPLEKQAHEYRTPTDYKPRVSGYDGAGREITYDHKPRVELLDGRSGRYAFKWIGFDGEEKTATFTRADAVDVVVSASVTEGPAGGYAYTYEVRNLPSSGTYLKRFIVQNFAPEVEPDIGGQLLPGRMNKQIQAYGEGNWINFAEVSADIQIDPGQTVTARLSSAAPPGLVRCRASAETVVEGADEEMPHELEEMLGGYNEYPSGYTVGPDERLKGLSAAERAKYLLETLPLLHKIGWMTDGALRSYEQHLKQGGLEEIYRRAGRDLQAEQITTEVFALVRESR